MRPSQQAEVRRLPEWTQRRSVRILAVALALLVASGLRAPTDAGSAFYRCRLGQTPERLSDPPAVIAPDRLASLAQWDAFAVQAIARVVTGQTPLQDAWPQFEALLRSGLFAGAYSSSSTTADPFLIQRGRRFLDACRRLASGPSVQLIRDLLGDEALVGKLRQEGLSEAQSSADWFFAERLRGGNDAAAWGYLLPFLLSARGCLADGEAVERCLQGVEQGKLTTDAAAFFGRTLLWDLRLYLLSRPGAADLASALALPDDALAADFVTSLSAAHLKCLLLGDPKLKPTEAVWSACDAAGFVAAHPGWEWVGHAAALAHELQQGTILQVTGDSAPVLNVTGMTTPLSYTVTPALGTTYAVPALVWPRSPEVAYEGVRCLQDTRLMNWPAPVSGKPTACALQYTVSFTQAGPGRIGFQYKLCGLELPMVSHRIEVSKAGAEHPPGSWQPATVQLPTPPWGYRPVYSGGPVDPVGQPRAIIGGRRFLELADGVHGMEYLIVYEVRASERDDLPAEFVFCDPNPRSDGAVAEKASADAEAAFAPIRAGGFSLAPSRARVHGRDCWVGRKGKGADGRFYYVLCRGTMTYYRRNALFPLQDYWEPLLGEQDIYDSTKIRDDTIAYAEAALAALRNVGPAGPSCPLGPRASPDQARAFIGELKSVLKEETDLRDQTLLALARWRQGTLDKDAAVRTVGSDVLAGYGKLAARATALQAPDADLQGLLEGLKTSLSIGAAAAHLIGKGIGEGEEERLTRATALLDSHKREREALQGKIAAAEAQYEK